jgi:hypothetical protein
MFPWANLVTWPIFPYFLVLPKELFSGQELQVLEELAPVDTILAQRVEVLLVQSLELALLAHAGRVGVGNHSHSSSEPLEPPQPIKPILVLTTLPFLLKIRQVRSSFLVGHKTYSPLHYILYSDYLNFKGTVSQD